MILIDLSFEPVIMYLVSLDTATERTASKERCHYKTMHMYLCVLAWIGNFADGDEGDIL